MVKSAQQLLQKSKERRKNHKNDNAESKNKKNWYPVTSTRQHFKI